MTPSRSASTLISKGFALLSSGTVLLAAGAILVSAGAISLAGCASSAPISDSYRDPAYSGGPVTKVAVFWGGIDERVRRVAEDEIVKSFSGGTVARASSEIIPTEALRDTSKIAAFLTKEGFDAILVARPVKPEEKISYVRAAGNPAAFLGNYGFYTYWANSYAQLISPGYIKDEEVFRIDSRLYLLSSRAMPLWAGISSIPDVSSLRDGIAEYSRGVRTSLREANLVK